MADYTTSDAISKRQEYENLRATLWTERSTFDATWRELADYYFPVRPRLFSPQSERNQGGRRTQKIIDSTGTYALNTLASGLHAGLTSPARPWMKLSTPDPSLAKYKPVKQWLYDVTELMHAVFQISNLYTALPLVYKDMACFGTAAMGVLDDTGTQGTPADLFRVYPYPIGSFALGMDNRGLATTFIREYVKTVGQLVEEFGGDNGQPLARGGDPDWSRFSTRVKDAWDHSRYETPIELCWAVLPNRDHDRDRLDYRAFPWTSCHFEKGSDAGTAGTSVLRESGYHEFPIMAPRWYASAEDTYGTDCPGLVALGDVKQLQVQQKRKGQAIEKLVNPPLQASTELRTQKVSSVPGDLTYVTSFERGGVKPIHEVRPDVSALTEDIRETQYRVNKAFFVDLIQMLGFSDPQRGSQPPTAREIDERHEEKLMVLGPVVDSTADELLDPLIDRIFAQLDRAQLLPPPPPELDGISLKVEYTSLFAQAQKLFGVVPQDRLIQTVIGLTQTLPNVRHKLNANAIVNKYADILGTDPDLIHSDDDASAMADAEAQAMQQQAGAQQTLQAAQAAKQLGTTPMGENTALQAVLQGATR